MTIVVCEKLGHGGMGEVFRATVEDRELCVKRAARDENEARNQVRLETEAQVARKLRHPNIVRVYGLVAVEGATCLAMEYVRGKNLLQFLSTARNLGARVSPASALHIVGEVCNGLAYAHARRDARSGKPLGIVHRDVSPPNIMISRDGEVKLIDFGISTSTRCRGSDGLGKLGYMSPEQAMGIREDHRTDVFAVGVLLYELVTGKSPFPGSDAKETLRSLRRGEVTPPSALASDVAGELEAIILKALRRNPRDRYQTIGELGEAIAAYRRRVYPKYSKRDFTLLTRLVCQYDSRASAEVPATTTVAITAARRGRRVS